MALRLYAVIGADHPLPDRTGVHGAVLDIVRTGELAVVVSPAEADEDTTDQDAVDHLDVITALVEHGPVVPLRLGTVAPDEDAVRDEVVAPSRDEFAEHLAATADVLEVLAIVQFDEDAAVRELMTRHEMRGAHGPFADRIALGEQVVERLLAAAHDWADHLLDGVVQDAEAVTVLETRQPAVVRYALLVRRDRLVELDVAMTRVPFAEVVPCHIEYVGPLPPVDFPLQTAGEDRDSSRWGW